MPTLDDYKPIVGPQIIEELRLLAGHLSGTRVLHVNSTAVGGGVAEILSRMAPLMNELGVHTRGDVIKGGEDFYAVTKKIHNALHGHQEILEAKDFQIFLRTQERNMKEMDLSHDIVFIHDPQPVALVD